MAQAINVITATTVTIMVLNIGKLDNDEPKQLERNKITILKLIFNLLPNALVANRRGNNTFHRTMVTEVISIGKHNVLGMIIPYNIF